MTARITELQVESFRGATNRAVIEFDPSKPLVVIFGENGTGKSTLVDAFDLIANERIGSLKDRSSANEKKHAPAIGKKPKDIKVVLYRGSDKWEGVYGTKISVSPSANRPIIEILRRSQLLRLVEAQPAKRYEVLQQFIDVDGVETSEKALDEATKEAETSLSKAIDDRGDAETELQSLWVQNGRPDSSWQTWAKSKTALSTEGLDEEIRKWNGLIAAIASFNTRLADYETALVTIETEESNLTKARAELQALQSSWSQQTPQLIATLEAATRLLDAGWSDLTCPVCTQQITPGELRSRIADSLGSMKSLKTLHDQEQVAVRAVASAKSTANTERGRLIKAALPLLNNAQTAGVSEVNGILLDLPQAVQQLQSTDVGGDDCASAVAVCKMLATLESDMTTLRDNAQRDRNQRHTILSQYKKYVDADASIHVAQQIGKGMEVAHQIVHDRRIGFVQQILNTVSDEAKRLYDIIHPGEDAKPHRLELDPDKRGSLLQFAEFAGRKDVEPQGYFSDSHLDTLGLCYWLALAKRGNPLEKIVVLDDVFTSVDSAHLGRIVELLDAECTHFGQMFILTHNRNWFDKYRFNQAAGNRADKIELLRWSHTRGVRHNRTKLEVDEVAQLAKRFGEDGGSEARQRLASRCGVLLEALLNHLSRQYRCSVPHTADGMYTLGDLLRSCAQVAKVMQTRRHSEPMTKDNEHEAPAASPLQPEFIPLSNLSVEIRNGIGCHFNTVAANLSDADVDAFAGATLAFANAIVCGHCGEIPQTDKASYHQCRCKRTRLILTGKP